MKLRDFLAEFEDEDGDQEVVIRDVYDDDNIFNLHEVEFNRLTNEVIIKVE